MAPPVLLAVAHGSPVAGGSAAARAVVARVRRLRPDLDVRLCFLDHEEPRLAGVGPGDVVVPLLLHPGQHVLRDLPALVGPGTLAPPLAPDPRLAAAARDRLAEAGVDPGEEWTVLVAGAGSADPAGQAAFRESAAQVGVGTRWSVVVGYAGSGLSPSLDDAVTAARGRVAAVPFVLGEGFMTRAVRALAERRVVVAEPLGDHPAVAATVLARFEAARHEAGRTARERARSSS